MRGSERMENKFNYYYSNEAEQFNFYRIPKILFTDKRFSKLSVEAKVLYGLLLDRMSLSVKNNWIDEDNRVYIYFKLEDVQEYMDIGKDKGIKLFSELDSEKGIGLIERKKQGLGKPTMIYVMNFSTNLTELKTSEKSGADVNIPDDIQNGKVSIDADYEDAEVQTSEKPKSESRVGNIEEISKNAEVLTSEIPTSGLLKNRTQEFGKSDSNNTNINNTEYSNINQSYQQDKELSKRERYQKSVCDNIDYYVLIQKYSPEKIDGIVNLMVDTMCADGDFIHIGFDKIPTMVITDVFLSLKSTHIEYVIECMEKNSTNISNIKNYLLRALYDAPKTIDFYYTMAVNRDLKNGGKYNE